jgi:hypothetical protein
VPERTREDIRKEIAAERQGLQDDVGALQTEVRRLVPFLIAGAVALALAAAGLVLAIRKLRKR